MVGGQLSRAAHATGVQRDELKVLQRAILGVAHRRMSPPRAYSKQKLFFGFFQG